MCKKLQFKKETMRFVVTTLAIFALIASGKAQLFTKIFEPSVFGCSLSPSPDQGYGVAAAKYDTLVLIKYNSSNVMQWSKTLTSDSGFVFGTFMATDDNGFILTFNQNYLNTSINVIKIDSAGNVEWSRKIYGFQTSINLPSHIVKSGDGNFLLAFNHYESNDTLSTGIVKIGSDGSIIWSSSLSQYNYATVESIDVSLDGSIFLAGSFVDYSTGDTDWFISKIHADGSNTIWSKRIGISGTDYLAECKVKATSDKGIIIGGTLVKTDIIDSDIYIVKLDSSGAISWGKQIESYESEALRNIICNQAGGYTLVGSVRYFGNHSQDVFMANLDSIGNLQFNTITGNIKEEFINQIFEVSPNEFLMTGFYSLYNNLPGSSFFSKGNLGINCGMQISGASAISSIPYISNNGILTDFDLSSDTVTVDEIEGQITTSDFCVSVGIFETENGASFSLYPNPAQNNIFINTEINENTGYAISNILGKVVLEGKISSNQKLVDISALPSGIYAISIQFGSELKVRKFLKE